LLTAVLILCGVSSVSNWALNRGKNTAVD
jgi:hypothetical protein